jgi:hypothetical protein
MVASGANARGRRLVLAAFAIAVAAFAVHVAWLLAGGPAGWEDVVMDWAYHVTLFGSAAACLLRARVDPPLRWAWAALGTGLALWGIGDVYWTIAFEDVKRIPYPSPADAGYLLALPCFYVAVGLMLRHRVGHFTPAQWVDGLIAATAVAAAGVLFLAPALIGLTKGNTAAVLTNLAYPAGDLVLIAFVAAGLVVSGIRGAAPLVVLAAGLGIWTAADSIYLYQEATSGYEGMGYDLLWTAGALVMASAACLRLGLAPRRSRTYTTPLWLPAAAGSGAAAILVWDHWDRLQDTAVILAGVTLLAVAAPEPAAAGSHSGVV